MTYTLRWLDPSTCVLKRAQYEAFEFSLFEGDIVVRNESHADPEKHEYRVVVKEGIPTRCECPADRNDDGPCKHRVAVAVRPAVLDAATRMRVIADRRGGG